MRRGHVGQCTTGTSDYKGLAQHPDPRGVCLPPPAFPYSTGGEYFVGFKYVCISTFCGVSFFCIPIAKEYGVTASRIGMITNHALRVVRHPSTSREVRELVIHEDN